MELNKLNKEQLLILRQDIDKELATFKDRERIKAYKVGIQEDNYTLSDSKRAWESLTDHIGDDDDDDEKYLNSIF